MKKIISISLITIFLVAIIIVAIFLLHPLKYKDIIDECSEEYGVDRYVVYSLINIESSYDKNALSKAGAVGLMQLLPSTAEDIANRIKIDEEINLYDEKVNIRLGCYYLSYLIDMYDDNLINALCAYNWGLTNVNNWLELGNIDNSGTITNIPVAETKKYVSKFNRNYKIYKLIYRK